MTEQRTKYKAGNERQQLEIIRQDDMAIIIKAGDVTICKEHNPATQKIEPAVIHLWPKKDTLLSYITIRQAEQLANNITQAVAIARRLDALVKVRADFERVTVEMLRTCPRCGGLDIEANPDYQIGNELDGTLQCNDCGLMWEPDND